MRPNLNEFFNTQRRLHNQSPLFAFFAGLLVKTRFFANQNMAGF